MPIKFRCHHCRQLLGISQRKVGQETDCPKCGRALRVPERDGELSTPVSAEMWRQHPDSSLDRALDELAQIGAPAGLQAAGAQIPPPPEPDAVPVPSTVDPIPQFLPGPLPGRIPQFHSDARPPAGPADDGAARPPVSPAVANRDTLDQGLPVGYEVPVPGGSPHARADALPLPDPQYPQSPNAVATSPFRADSARDSSPGELPALAPIPLRASPLAASSASPSTNFDSGTTRSANPGSGNASSGSTGSDRFGLKRAVEDQSWIHESDLLKDSPPDPPLPREPIRAAHASGSRQFRAEQHSAASAGADGMLSADRSSPISDADGSSPVSKTRQWIVVAAGVVVLAWLCFIIGYLAGHQEVLGRFFDSFRPDEPQLTDPKVTEPARPVVQWARVTGRISYRTPQGDTRADEGARILSFPAGNPPTEKLQLAGLRPTDTDEEFRAAVVDVRRVGGDVAQADADGIFELSLRAPGQYRLVVISHYQWAPKDTTPSADLLAFLGTYFERVDLLLGELAVQEHLLSVHAREVQIWDHNFSSSLPGPNKPVEPPAAAEIDDR